MCGVPQGFWFLVVFGCFGAVQMKKVKVTRLNVLSHDDSKMEVVVFGHAGRQETDAGIRWAEFGEESLLTTFFRQVSSTIRDLHSFSPFCSH